MLNIQAADVSTHNGGWYEASQVARRLPGSSRELLGHMTCCLSGHNVPAACAYFIWQFSFSRNIDNNEKWTQRGLSGLRTNTEPCNWEFRQVAGGWIRTWLSPQADGKTRHYFTWKITTPDVVVAKGLTPKDVMEPKLHQPGRTSISAELAPNRTQISMCI